MKPTQENLELLKEFARYCIENLRIKDNATVQFMFEHDPTYPSAGGYDPAGKVVMVAVRNRAIADVMRTMAHELTHHKQNELGRIGPNDFDNQELEDESNVMSGRLVRFFGRKHKEIYSDLL